MLEQFINLVHQLFWIAIYTLVIMIYGALLSRLIISDSEKRTEMRVPIFVIGLVAGSVIVGAGGIP